MIDTERIRLEALRELNILDTGSGEGFDRITRAASQLFNLPMAAISLTDTDRQWFKSRVGMDHPQIPRHKAPCAQIATAHEVLVIPDLLQNPFYQDCPIASAGIRFYAGAPLVTRDGHGLGSMCVLGFEPRQVTAGEIALLQGFAAMVMAEIELQHPAGRIDALTGLPNRQQLDEDLWQLARAHPGEKRIGILVEPIDMARTAAALRTIGPAYVDDLVRAVSYMLDRVLGPETTLYRIDTLVYFYLAEETEDPELAGAIEAVLDRIRRVVMLNGVAAFTNAAVGAARFNLAEATPADILRDAFTAAQCARESKARFRVHSNSLDEARGRRLRLLGDITAALGAKDQLALAYLPRVDMRSGLCTGAGAQLRWRHPALGDVPLSEFMPLVDQTVLARDVTEWVLYTVFRQVAEWTRKGIHCVTSIEVSGAALEQGDFATRLTEMTEHFAIPPQAIQLEFAASTLAQDDRRAIALMNSIGATGFHLGIGDFDTGRSSLLYLEEVQASFVRIGQRLVRGLGAEPRGETLVGAMIALMHKLDYRVVAEAVGTRRTYDILLGLGCDEAQGDFVGTAVTAAAVEGLVGGRRTSLA